MKKIFKLLPILLIGTMLFTACSNDEEAIEKSSLLGVWAGQYFPKYADGLMIFKEDGTALAFWNDKLSDGSYDEDALKGTYTATSTGYNRIWTYSLSGNYEMPRTSTRGIVELTDTKLTYSNNGNNSTVYRIENSSGGGIVGVWTGPGDFPVTYSHNDDFIYIFKSDNSFVRIKRHSSDGELYFASGSYTYDGSNVSTTDDYRSDGTQLGSSNFNITVENDSLTSGDGTLYRIK